MRYWEIISEALPLSTAKKYRKMWDQNTYADIFNTSPLKKDKNAFRLYIPFKHDAIDNGIKPPEEIINYLDNKDYYIKNEQDYIKGLATNIRTGKQIKIGKLVADNLDIKKMYDNDPSRTGSKLQDMYIIISRHPYDIAGMSTDRGWTSCMDLTNGVNKKYVKMDVKHGTLIAYLVNNNDLNIKNPIGRVLLKPFINVQEPYDIIFQREAKPYGTFPKEALNKVDEWVNQIDQKVNQLYKIHSALYKDDINPTKIKFDDELKTKIFNYPSTIRKIEDPSEELQFIAVTTDLYTIRYIKNPTENVQLYAIKQYTPCLRIINNPTEKVQMFAVKKDPAYIEDIDNPTEKVQLYVINKNPDLIEKIKNPSQKAWDLYKKKFEE